uniref:Uncharacterized protein n=1 Tax=Meloidogyne enterolobii TaxID=390850 RepID=A0A6V7Y1D8_MELEN|nr:unnamed protein product [Meloidogyne enterolobii]
MPTDRVVGFTTFLYNCKKKQKNENKKTKNNKSQKEFTYLFFKKIQSLLKLIRLFKVS